MMDIESCCMQTQYPQRTIRSNTRCIISIIHLKRGPRESKLQSTWKPICVQLIGFSFFIPRIPVTFCEYLFPLRAWRYKCVSHCTGIQQIYSTLFVLTLFLYIHVYNQGLVLSKYHFSLPMMIMGLCKIMVQLCMVNIVVWIMILAIQCR